jgi:1-acyl-sn-glycerol-3-phosphate acyltransferase
VTLLRSTLFNVFFYVVTFLLTLVPATLARLFAPHRIIDVARLWARIMLWALRVICGIRLLVSGRDSVAGDGACLIASTHQSAFDTMVWLTLLPRCCYVLKQELLRVPLFGPLPRAAGMIAVDREAGAAALRGLLRQGETAARNRRQIVIFPEGTRAPPGIVLPLQPGVAALAARTGLAVVPAVTDSGNCWGRKAFQKRAGTIHIRLLEPIPATIGRDQLMRRLENAFHTPVIPSDQPVENSVGRVAGELVTHRSDHL